MFTIRNKRFIFVTIARLETKALYCCFEDLIFLHVNINKCYQFIRILITSCQSRWELIELSDTSN